MQGQQTQDAPQNDGLPDAVARLLADEPMASARAWQDLGPATPEATAAAAAAAAWLLDEAPPTPGDIGTRIMIRLPEGSPEAYARLGAAVLAAWTDRELCERWRRDPRAMAASLDLPPPIPDLVRVVGPADGRLPQRDDVTIPLPSPGSPSSSRAAAIASLASTEFGWLLAGMPDGAEALGLAFPGGAPAAAARERRRTWLALWLRPRPLLLSGGLVCLLLAIGLSLSVGGDGSLAGAAMGPAAAWRLPAAAFSLLLGLALIVLAERRR